MNTILKNILSLDRKSFLLILAIASAAIFTITISIYANKAGKNNNTLKMQLEELQLFNKGLSKIKNIVETKEKKIGLTRARGVVTTLEQILNNLGLKANKLKPLGKKRVNEFIEENAELEIKNIDLNEIVNLLYKIELSPAPMKIKSALIKTTFENTNIFILNLTVSLIRKA